jgi:transposase
VPKSKDRTDAKTAALLQDGTLNPFPERVSDPKFQAGDFFDPRDLVQVRYEMLRRVSVDDVPVTQVTGEYGVSRPTFYQAKANFDQAGVAGLAPKKRGPRGPHKLQGEILAFVEKRLIAGEPIRAREVANLVRREFSVTVHPRTIERALGGKKTPRRAPVSVPRPQRGRK